MKDSRASCGGITMECVKPIRYHAPQGPTRQMRAKVGLGGENCGPSGTQGKYDLPATSSGRPGLRGQRLGNSPAQGKR